MNNLTDLEICKRIAEIEGEEVTVRFDWDDNLRAQLSYGSVFEDRMPEYNPLTDDALCFQLMCKYGVTFGSCQFYKNMFTAFTYSEHEIKVLPKAHERSPNKAICLTIIKAHK
jgi:hypothetical protein